MIRRFRRALPSPVELFAGSAAWALALGGSAAGMLWLRDWRGAPLADVSILFLGGAVLAFPPAIAVARLLAAGRRPETVFAAFTLCLAAATVALTGGLFALDYRSYYAQWHGPAFTELWAMQFAFTTVVALYQFAVLGLRLLFPLGFAALFVAAFLLTRVEMRRRR